MNNQQFQNMGNSMGTSIADLKAPQQYTQNNQQNNLDTRSVHSNTSHGSYTVQSYPHSSEKSSQKSSISINPNISKLIKNINESLEDYAPSKSKNTNDKQDAPDTKEEEQNEDTDDDWLDSIPPFIKEIILFVIIYYILSTNTVKKIVGTYLTSINPNPDGNISSVGIISYGIFLISLFIIAKKIFLKD